jgi:anaerobic dimethyl sulfoxide reductase subunit B (iron-sulfur subunit)
MSELPFFHFQPAACSGCKTCVVACLDGRNDNTNRPRRRVWEYSGGGFNKLADGTYEQDVFTYYLSLSCHHCQDPPCLKACPSQAITKKPNGLVTLGGQCQGCRTCEKACPYQAPVFDLKTGFLDKCDYCVERLNCGQLPLCVEACPTGALTLAEKETFKTIGLQPPPLPDWMVTKPRLVAGWPKRFNTDAYQTLNKGRIVNHEEG